MKNLRRLVLVVLVGTILPIGDANLHRRLFAHEKDKKVEVKTVFLSSIYSTSRQKGLKLVDQGVGDEAFRNEMRELQQHAVHIGASNIFLARGESIADAVKATWLAFTSSHHVDEPVSPHDEVKSNSFWLVIYFGTTGSTPPAWRVTSVEIKEKQLRVRFAKPLLNLHTDDGHPYFVWVPLGKLAPGSYSLELFDQNEKQVTLLRRVKIPSK